MNQGPVAEAEFNLKGLIQQLNDGSTDVIYIIPDNKPGAELRLPSENKGVRIGTMKGKMHVPEWFDSEEANEEIHQVLNSEELLL